MTETEKESQRGRERKRKNFGRRRWSQTVSSFAEYVMASYEHFDGRTLFFWQETDEEGGFEG